MTETNHRPFAVVTGGSQGIGYELAAQFAQNGFDVLIAAHGDGLDEAAKKLAEYGTTITTARADLTDYEGVESLYAAIRDTARPVDALALNAGLGLGGHFVGGTALEDELRLIALNVTSTVHLAKRVAPDMVARGAGRILIVSSVSGTTPTPFEAVYGGTKAFGLSFAEALRNELAEHGVSVTALLPAQTETNFFHRGDMDDTAIGAGDKNDPTRVAQQGYEALMAGKDKVVGGNLAAKFKGNVTNRILSEEQKARAHHDLARPGSADNDTD
ncbi:SDR family NAD(P)-dependent oxidoreductase [uncultured Salinisphaera sp.]|uniref:SDR family NAD(P)-dependent oxidoreductase n=1 Tax=uncultured Salinisphaera sp. TaxID=359372 RepID=UPI0032B12D94|tara:strand:+ start:8502 stop:9317 length:816 start_codon:yes stop_codon:yes gene_type:complete